ncbi:hypothetical protein [Stappia sp. ES.058]|uniref:hypothetical protein n=1 Tax=Stappia sp. ES.058 TaxID=1881061 RepID=UPI00087A1275|nr:hypothetical protein [Stappia sp. ES.058]SDU02021.1 hypothetical protein SAMN05428979_1150 [Stappia sp. ES.058]
MKKTLLAISAACLFLLSPVVEARECISKTMVITPDADCIPTGIGSQKQPPTPDYAFEKAHWHEYARYVQSLTNVWLNADGRWHIETKFSNGHRTAKQTMGVSIVVVNGEGECLFGAVHEVNLNPSFGGSANEYISKSSGSIPVSEISLVADTRFAASKVTSHVIRRFNEVRPYGLTLPNSERRACR